METHDVATEMSSLIQVRVPTRASSTRSQHVRTVARARPHTAKRATTENWLILNLQALPGLMLGLPCSNMLLNPGRAVALQAEYLARGYEVEVVPHAPVEDRCAFIEDTIARRVA